LINQNHDPGAEIEECSPAVQSRRIDVDLETSEFAAESRVAA